MCFFTIFHNKYWFGDHNISILFLFWHSLLSFGSNESSWWSWLRDVPLHSQSPTSLSHKNQVKIYTSSPNRRNPQVYKRLHSSSNTWTVSTGSGREGKTLDPWAKMDVAIIWTIMSHTSWMHKCGGRGVPMTRSWKRLQNKINCARTHTCVPITIYV